MNIEIRKAEEKHGEAIEYLSQVLGYTITAEQVNLNLAKLDNSEQKVWVAASEDDIVAYCHAGITNWVMMKPMVEIFAIVVSPPYRSKGIGELFIHQVEKFAKKSGVNEVWVRSNQERKDSHSFFKHLGFSNIKTQTVYVRNI